MRTRVVFVLLFVLSIFSKAEAQTDTAFWFAMPHVIGNANRDTPILMRVMPVDLGANVRIYTPASNIIDTTIWVDAAGVRSVDLTKFKGLLENMPHGQVLNRGIKIESDQYITAYFDEASTRNPEIYALKGQNALGTAFYVPGQTTYTNNVGDGTLNAYHAFDIVAVEDNTVVTIRVTNDIVGPTGAVLHAANSTFTVTLNRGQTYSCRAAGRTPDKHLGGSTVSSTKQVAVTMVDDFVGVGGCSDASGDQLVPISILGTEYASVSGYFSDNDQAVIMAMANYPTTNVTITRKIGTAAAVTTTVTLTAGQSYQFAYTSNANGAVYIKSSNPVGVMHMTGIGCELSYAVLPPLGSCIGSKKVGIVRPGKEATYLILVAPKIAGSTAIAGGYLFNGNTGVIKASDFTELPGNSSWQYARVALSLTNYPAGSSALITNTQNVKFHAGIIYGVSGVGGSYGYFSNYAIAPTVTPPDDTVFCNKTNTGELKFKSTVNGSYFEWVNDNTAIGLAASGSGNIPSFLAVNNTNATIIAHISVVPRANDCDGIPRSFTITVHPTPKLVVSKKPAPLCIPKTANITADSLTNQYSTAGMTLYYYTDRALTTPVANPQNISTSGKFYIRGMSAQGCLSNIDSVETVINGIPVITASNPPAVCPGGTADLTDDALIAGNPPGLNYAYYKDPTSGVQYVDSTKAPKGTYYIIATNISGCASSPVAIDVTEKEYAVAADITVRDTAICKGSSVVLTASSAIAGASFTWYKNSTLTQTLGTGTTYTTKPVNGDSTFYVAVTGTLKCTNVSGTGAIVKVKVKSYATAADIAIRDTAICEGSIVKLTASSTLGGTIKWYRNSALTDSIGVGLTYTTKAIQGDSTYYLTVQNSAYCANQSGAGTDVKVTMKEYGVAADVKVPDTAICVGGSVKLTAVAPSGSTITWYKNAALTTAAGTGYTYTTGNILADSVFYVTIENSTTCKNKTGTATVVRVTKKDYVAAATITVKDTTACKGSTVTLEASTTLAGGILKWYRSSALTDTIRTGTQYTTGVINNDSTYYVTVENATSCANQTGVAVRVVKKEYATAANITAADAAVCKGETVQLAASSSVGTINWYKNSALTTLAGSGNLYTTKAIMADSTYYLTVSSTTLCANKVGSTAVVKVTKKEYATAASISAGNASACEGTKVTLTASTSAGTIKWYRDVLLTDSAGVGPSFLSDVINADVKYYLTVSSTTLCANKTGTAAVVTVTSKGYATAANISVADAVVCKGATANLTASSSAGTIKWYRNSMLTDSVGVGTSYTTNAINNDSTYYLTVEGTALCANKPSTAAVVKVTKKEYAVSSDITVAGASVCKGSIATLTATSSAGTIKWYKSAALTDSIATGGTYTTKAIQADSVYYVTVENSTLCANKAGTAAVVNVTKKDYATAGNITIRDTAICKDTKVKLTAASSLTGSTIKWYRNSTLTDSIAVGPTYTTNVIQADSVYYLTIQNSAYCANIAGAGADVKVKMKNYGVAANVTVPDTAICIGGAVNLIATAQAGSVITWYSNAALTSVLDTGYNYTTGNILADSVFYVTIENATTCKNKAGTATVVNVTKKDYADVATISVRDTTACKGTTVDLSASTTLTAGVLKWYRSSSLTDTIRTGTTYNTGAINADSTYYVTVENTATCANQSGVPVHVVKKEYATAADLSVADVAVCKDETVALTASSSAGTIKWYKNSALTDSIATGASYTTQAITGDSTYYLTVSGTALCANQAGTAAILKVTKKEYAIATDITVADAAACKGTTIDLTASSAAGVIKWYRDALLLDSAGVGTTFTTDVVNADQEYYLTVAGTTLCANKAADAAVVKVTKKGYATAADIAVADTVACKGTTLQLAASSAAGTIKWYRDAAMTDSVGVGTSYTTNAIDADSSYYLSVEGAALCANKPVDAAVIKIVKKEYATSSDITVAGVAVCKSTTAVLTASSSAGIIKWYRDLALTDSVGTGETYTTNTIEADSVYYVTVKGTALCENQSGAAAVVNVTKKDYAAAADITATGTSVCKGTTATLTASSSAGIIKWYRDAALTDSVGVGTSYTTGLVDADSIYYLTVAGTTLCANKAGDAATATVLKKEYATATDLNVFDTSACIGTTTQIRANSASGTIKWYRDANLTDSVGIGDWYTTNPINADSFYYATVNGATLCENKAGYAAMATVIKRVYATAGDLDVFGTSVCRGETADLAATSLTAGTITWYRDELLTDAVSIGNNYTTNIILEDSTYYVTISGASFCANEPGNAAIVKVKKKEYALAGDLTVADVYACKGNTVNLIATSTGLGVVKWYRDALLTDSVGIGNTYTTDIIQADSVYYATIASEALCANKAADAAVVRVTKNEYATAADLTVADAIACKGTTVALTAGSTAGTIKWFSDALLRNNVATGVNYTTQPIDADSTYYLTVSSTTLCANKAADAAVVKITKKEYAIVTDVAVADAAVCKGDIANLTASSSGNIIKWYRNAALTDSVGTGGAYATNIIEADSVYYVTVSGTTLCENKTGDAAVVTVTKKEYAIAADLQVADVAACKGTVVDLAAASTLGTIKWYRDAALTDSVGAGTAYTIDALQGDSTYYLTVSGTTVCANKVGTAAVINVTKKEYAVAADLNTADAAVCKGSVAGLTASSTGGTIKWYRDYRLTDSIAVGTGYTTNTIEADSTYYITVSGTTLCANKIGQSAVVKVTKKEYALATDLTVANAAICKGSTAELTAIANGTVIKWYRDALLTDSVGVGANYITNTILADSVYYVTTAGSTLCANKAGDAAVVNVTKKEYATAADITTADAAVCIGNRALLNAAGSGTIKWYRDALLTDSVGNGTRYTTNIISADSTYYITVASATLCANQSGAAAVVKVTKKEYATAADLTVADAAACRGSVAELAATSASGNTIKWYVNAQLTDSVGVGTRYTTDAIESDMEYYVTASSTTLCANKAGTGAIVKVTKKEYNTANDISVPDVSVCKGSAALVTATATGTVIKWYRDALLTDSVGVGTSYTTKVINADSLYYVTTYSATSCANQAGDAAMVNVIKKEYAVAADLTLADISVCKGSTAVLSASSVADTIQWYRNALLTDRVATGGTYTTNTINADSTYYVTASSSTLCANKAGTAGIVKVIKKEYAIAGNLQVADVAACKGSLVALSANSTLGTIKWYRDVLLADSIGVGNTYTTGALQADSVYYVTVAGATVCANKAGDAAVINVRKKEYAVAADLNTADVTVCKGTTATLAATSTGGTIKWYRDYRLTDSVAIGTSYTTNAIEADSIYYATVSGTALCANKSGDAAVVRVTKNEYAVAGDVTVADAAICKGLTTVLTASGSGTVIKWYRDNLLTDSVGTGTSYTTNAILADSVYYVTTAGNSLCANKAGEAAMVKVVKKEYATAADITAADAAVCIGSKASLNASSTGGAITWYRDALLTDSIASGTGYTTNVINADSMYYVTVAGTTLCENKAGAAAVVKVSKKEYAVAADLTVSDAAACRGSVADLLATSAAGNTIKWYVNQQLTDSVGAGTRYTTEPIQSDMIYYVTASSTTLCANKAGTAAVVRVSKKEYALARDLAVPDVSVCKGSTALVSATASGSVIKWYRDALLTDSIAMGTTYTTNVINADSTYYLTTYSSTLCANTAEDAAVAKVIKKEYAIATDITAADVAVCKGAAALLTATSVADTIQWYRDVLLTDRVATGGNYNTNVINADSVYYITTSSTTLCANQSGSAAVVKVIKKEYAVAANLTVADAYACKGSTVVLAASSSAETIRWYRDMNLADSVGAGTSYTTNTIEADSVYYVTASGTTLCANKAGTAAIVKVTKREYAVAADISTRDTIICRGSTVQLAATSNITAGNLKWYTDETLTNEVGSGLQYTSDVLLENSIFYVTVNNNEKCANKPFEATPVAVNMRDLPSITSQPRGTGSVCEGRGTAYSVVSAGENVTYQWQLDKNDGFWFVDIPGETSQQLTLPAIALSMDGYRYRCVVSNDCGQVNSGIVITSVKSKPSVTGDPLDKLVCEKQDAIFGVTAEGYGTLKYVWQVDKKNGAGFSTLADAATDSITISAVTEAMNGYVYRCIVTGGCAPSDTSNMAALTVPVAKVGDIASQALCNNAVTQAVNLSSSIANTNFTWINNNSTVGLAASGSGNIIDAFTAVNKGVDADSAVVTVTPEAFGCIGPVKSFTIVVNPIPVISSTAPADICSNSQFNYAVESKTANTAFRWTRGVVSGISNEAATGTGDVKETLVSTATETKEVTYTYTLQAAGCSNILPVKVKVKPKPVATIAGSDICAEETLLLTGTADLTDVTYAWTAAGGKTATSKNYEVSNATTEASGTYKLVVAKEGCSSAAATYVQKVKPLPVATISGTSGVCIGKEIVLTGSSDIGADSYAWTGPSGFTTSQSSFTLANATELYQGTYNLVVEKDGCKSHASSSVVQVNKYPVVTVEKSAIACESSSVWVKAYSSLPLSTYVWQGMGQTSTDQEMTIKPVTGDKLKYYVTVSRFGCAVKDSVEFIVKKSPAVQLPAIADVCQSVAPFTLSASETTGLPGKGAFSGASVSADGLFNPSIAAGTYVISYTYTSEEGCKDAKTVSFKVYPIPGVNAGSDKSIYEGNSVRLDGSISGNYTKYTWSDPSSTALPSMNTLTPMVSPMVNTTYILSAENAYGCVAKDEVNVTVTKFRIPNSFSPNGDGTNDDWTIPGLSKYPNSRVEVYNRWGTKLFVSKGYVKAWDGRYNGSYVPAATYYYLIYLNDGIGNEKPIAGWVEVMR